MPLCFIYAEKQDLEHFPSLLSGFYLEKMVYNSPSLSYLTAFPEKRGNRTFPFLLNSAPWFLSNEKAD